VQLIHHVGQRLARVPWIAGAIREGADLSAFRQRPPLRLVVGLSLVGLSYVTCWPLIAVLGYLALRWQQPLWLVIGGPAAYGLSCLIFSTGVFVAGKNMLHFGHLFGRWLARTVTMRMMGPTDDQRSVELSDAERVAGPSAPSPPCTPTSMRSRE
jgi:hypothetical protein